MLNLDAVILSDAGNVVDALFMAARAALWDTKVPRTRPIEYRAPNESKAAKKDAPNAMDVDESLRGFDTRDMARTAADFELPDYWDEGEELQGREAWPICITLNLVRLIFLVYPNKCTDSIWQSHPIHFLDATLTEEASIPLRLHLMFSFPSSGAPTLQSMRLSGPGELDFNHLKSCISVRHRTNSPATHANRIYRMEKSMGVNSSRRWRLSCSKSKQGGL